MDTVLRTSILSPYKLQQFPAVFSTHKFQKLHGSKKARCVPSQPSNPQSSSSSAVPDADRLKIGSPIVIVEAPQTLKTAASMPNLRVNAGIVKPGDVGRIVARKPKDVWAVRLAIGTYLIDGKNFKPLDDVDDQ